MSKLNDKLAAAKAAAEKEAAAEKAAKKAALEAKFNELLKAQEAAKKAAEAAWKKQDETNKNVESRLSSIEKKLAEKPSSEPSEPSKSEGGHRQLLNEAGPHIVERWQIGRVLCSDKDKAIGYYEGYLEQLQLAGKPLPKEAPELRHRDVIANGDWRYIVKDPKLARALGLEVDVLDV